MEYLTAIFFGTSVCLFVMYNTLKWHLKLERQINEEQSKRINLFEEYYHKIKACKECKDAGWVGKLCEPDECEIHN